MAQATTDDGVAPAAEPDRHITVRKADILAALTERDLRAAPGARDKLRRLSRLLAAIYHHQFLDKLERLRDDYHHFNPESEPVPLDPAARECAEAALVATLRAVLEQANFVAIPLDEIARAHAEHHLLRVKVDSATEAYREILCFRRGRHTERIEVREGFWLRKRRVEVTIYDRVVLVVITRPAGELGSAQLRRLRRRGLRPGSILIKYFRHVASPDLDMLFPDAHVVMTLFDKLKLAVPAIAGGVPILLKLPAVTVLFAVMGFYLGLSGSVGQDDWTAALAALSALAAFGGFLVQQWIRYQRQALQYHKAISDNVYFRNLNNNAGIFDYLIGGAEEQDVKESFLAYYFLLAATAPPDAAGLKASIETWLRDTFGEDAAFDIGDALAKLDRLGLLHRSDGRLAVVPLDEALASLHRVWGDLFPAAATVE
jgi:hypothetical protein